MNDQLATITRQSISLVSNGDEEAARKIKMLLPYGNKLTDDNALALAAYSRLHGLDPFNGECYFLVRERTDDQGNVVKREELGVYPGIRGKRKVAKLQLQSIDPEASYRIDYMVVGPDAVGLKPQPGEISVVVQAELRDTQSTSRYITDTIKLRDAGIDVETTKAIMGRPPVWTGFGVVKQSEVRYIKLTPIALAKKRAESDATNQRFDLPFSDDALAEDIAPDIVDVEEVDVVENKPAPALISTAQAATDLGFPPEPESPPQPELLLPPPSVNLKFALEVVGKLDNRKYGEFTSIELGAEKLELRKLLGGDKPLTDERKEEAYYKLEAIRVIEKAVAAGKYSYPVAAQEG